MEIFPKSPSKNALSITYFFPLLIAVTFSLIQMLPLPQKDRLCLVFQIYLPGKNLLNMYRHFSSHGGLANGEHLCVLFVFFFFVKEKDIKGFSLQTCLSTVSLHNLQI